MILTDGEVGAHESSRVKQTLALTCPATSLAGIIGVGNEVTRATLRSIVEGGLGPSAIVFDNDTEDSIADTVLGSVSALVSSQLREVNWPGGKMVGSQPRVQCNSAEVCTAWALYAEAQLPPAAATDDDQEWEVVQADAFASLSCADAAPAQVRWLGGAHVSIAPTPGSPASASAAPLPTLLVTRDDDVKSMCVAAALARCRHPSCPRPEATALALRYGFVCAEADSVIVAVSDSPSAAPSSAVFGIAIPSQPLKPVAPLPGPFHLAQSMSCSFGPPPSLAKSTYPMHSWGPPSRSSFLGSDVQCFGPSTLSFARPHHQTCSYGPPSSPNYNSPPSHAPGPPMKYLCAAALPPPLAQGLAQPLAYLPPPPAYTPQFPAYSPQSPAYTPQSPAYHPHHAPAAHPAASSSAYCPPPPVPQLHSPPSATYSPPPRPASASAPSLLDVLGALRGASWTLQHPAVAEFIALHAPAAAAACSSDALTTVAVIVVLRTKFKSTKNGWHAHVRRAARWAREVLGDAEYAQRKVAMGNCVGE